MVDLALQALNACPIDSRRDLTRNVLLAGGTTQLPGFQERLQRELQAHLPSGHNVQVHTQPKLAFAAFAGACVVANLDTFGKMCMQRSDYSEHGYEALVDRHEGAW